MHTCAAKADAGQAFTKSADDVSSLVWYVQTHLRKRGGAVAEDVTEKNLRELAFDTQRYSGAAIANLVNLAAMRAERDGREQIQYKDLTDVSSRACCTAASLFK